MIYSVNRVMKKYLLMIDGFFLAFPNETYGFATAWFNPAAMPNPI